MLLVISELRGGGAEQVVVHLATALRAMGLAVEVLCIQDRGILADGAEAAGVPVVALRSLRPYDLPAIMALARELRRFRPDVINVHDRSSLPYVCLANWLAGRRPVAFSCHGLLLADQLRSKFRDRLAMRDVRALTAVSEPSGREYARLMRWAGLVDLVENGVSIPPLRGPEAMSRARGEFGILSEDLVFLAIGNVKPEKGYEDLLDAASLLREGGTRLRILIAGSPADGGYSARLAARSAAGGLENTVRFLGYREDAQALRSAADVFVLPSRKEGLPMALLEAMAAGLPVVATAVGGVPQAVCNESTGLVVGAGAPRELAAAMTRLAGDGPLRARLGAAARQQVMANYSVQKMAGAYLSVFNRIAARTSDYPRLASTAAGAPKPRVLMMGPLPPLTGGMATVADNLRRSRLAAEDCRLVAVNNGKMTPPGRSLWAGVLAQVRLLGRVLANQVRLGAQVAHIHTCALFSFWRDCVHVLALRPLGCKVVWHIHDGSFAGFMAKGPAVRRGVIRAALRMGSAVIVLSEQSLRAMRPLAPEVNWVVVPNAVPVPPRPAQPTAGPTRFLFLGNLTRRKGAFDLVDAAELACHKGMDAVVRLAGAEVSAGQKEELVGHISALKCRERISLLGLVTGPDKDRALEDSDCLVLPSYVEGLPMAVLEGMAYGLPVIASSVGSIPEVVCEGREGFLVAPGDVAALADRMARIAADAGLRRSMGAAARRRIEQSNSLDMMAERVLKVYRDAITPGAGPGPQNAREDGGPRTDNVLVHARP